MGNLLGHQSLPMSTMYYTHFHIVLNGCFPHTEVDIPCALSECAWCGDERRHLHSRWAAAHVGFLWPGTFSSPGHRMPPRAGAPADPPPHSTAHSLERSLDAQRA